MNPVPESVLLHIFQSLRDRVCPDRNRDIHSLAVNRNDFEIVYVRRTPFFTQTISDLVRPADEALVSGERKTVRASLKTFF